VNIEVREESNAAFDTYAEIPIAFSVESVFECTPSGQPGGALGRLVPVEQPYTKDYDAIRGNHPLDWPRQFDTSGWGVLSAWQGGTRVGGIVIAHGSGDLDLLEQREELAVLWDLRVRPRERGMGVGSGLMKAAEEWAYARGCRVLKVETQNINVAACRFYSRHGFELRMATPRAYADLPEEVQLLWYKMLARQQG
jgi:GNAT superfamily N-acetyltransferase